MCVFRSRHLSVIAMALALVTSPVLAQQNNDPKAAEQAAAEAAKETQKKINEIAEATRLLNGPAGNPECVWLGRRVVSLLWRDDLDTAFRHLDLYDRFGCPSGHIQATFRCLVRQGNIDPKAQESLNGRVHSCWIDPTLAAAAPPPAAAQGPANSTGTTTR
ncbi:MAG: beta-1-3, beta-1-6-glucan biosynthesis protein [Pseudolabrys sp.]|nr:beta-1-3, beta-1-6-glucan biosynthesis protein [Pseudolabrys sp.]